MPLNIDWQQILLHLFNLVLLFGILYFLLYKPVSDFMDKRAEAYVRTKRETEETLAAAKEKDDALKEKLAASETLCTEMKAAAQREAEEEKEKIVEKARREAEAIKSEAVILAKKEKEEIVNSAQKELAASALAAAKKLVSDSTSESYDSFLAQAESEKKA